MTDASYPDDLRYHEEHDWVRMDGDVATFGITWYAQDTPRRGRLLQPAGGGRDGHQGRRLRRAGVDQGGLGADRAAVRRGGRGNEALEGSESTINDDPYGEGWLIKVRMSDPAELDALMDAAAYRRFVDEL